jgi:uncharacterized protein YerC
MGKKNKRAIAAHQQAARRAQVARLLRSGYDASEIAHKTGAHPATVRKDIRMLEERWYWSSRRDTAAYVMDQLAHLEEIRTQAWKAYHEYANRHGEGHQNGYLGTALRATEQITALLRLEDPNAAMGGPEVTQAQVVEVLVTTREQAEAIESGMIDYDQMREIEEQGGGEG